VSILIITDPPTRLAYPRRREPHFGGTYSAVFGVRRKLEELGHTVSTLVLLPSGDLISEEELRRFALEMASFDESMLGGALPGSSALGQLDYEAILLLLKSHSLKSFLPRFSSTLQKERTHPVIFVSTSQKMNDFVRKTIASTHLETHVILKPGVARIPKKELEQVIRTLGEGRSSQTQTKEG
jgi:hypothetical protein